MLYLRVLNKIIHRYIRQSSEHTMVFKICQGSEYIRVLNMSGFITKTLQHIDA